MKFPAVEDIPDIPDIETGRVNIKKLDPLLYDAVESMRFAVRQRNNFKIKSDYERELITFLRTQLRLFAITHKSIRILLRRAYREPDKTLIADAASLVREQIEKLFIGALALEDPHRWIRQIYAKSTEN